MMKKLCDDQSPINSHRVSRIGKHILVFGAPCLTIFKSNLKTSLLLLILMGRLRQRISELSTYAEKPMALPDIAVSV
ncbi:MAG: hypothetical protein NTZ35_11400 [Ignavibacteriales bacterium]|nr:hypothetical protein [Ignavibacteriales bacterium]